MLVRLISKTGLVSGLVSAPFFVDFSNEEIKHEKTKKALVNSYVEKKDIEIFEKIKDCKFVFVSKEKNENYGVKSLLEKSTKDEDLKSALIDSLFLTGEECKKGEYINIFQEDLKLRKFL